MGTLEAKDIDKIDTVSSFIKAMVNRLRGLDNLQIALFYVRYVEEKHAIF